MVHNSNAISLRQAESSFDAKYQGAHSHCISYAQLGKLHMFVDDCQYKICCCPCLKAQSNPLRTTANSKVGLPVLIISLVRAAVFVAPMPLALLAVIIFWSIVSTVAPAATQRVCFMNH